MNTYLQSIVNGLGNSMMQYADSKSGRLGTFIPVQPHEYWDRLIEFPAQEDEEIRYLHEDYGYELQECVYCDRVYEAEQDLDGWFKSEICDECYALRDEGRD